jgi:hypothetical protein
VEVDHEVVVQIVGPIEKVAVRSDARKFVPLTVMNNPPVLGWLSKAAVVTTGALYVNDSERVPMIEKAPFDGAMGITFVLCTLTRWVP